MIIIGVVVLVAAVAVAVAGALSDGAARALPDQVAVAGYHVTDSVGAVFLYGIAVGAAGMLGLSLVIAGLRRARRRTRANT